jgi:futalosine hydrolase
VSPDWDRQLLTTSTLGPYVGRRRGPVTVLAAGAGGPAAAAGTAVALAVAQAAGDPFALVLSMGVAGGFRGLAEIGDLAVAQRLVAADLGAESGLDDLREPAGQVHEMDRSLGFHSTGAPPLPRTSVSSADGRFLTLDDLGLGSSTITPDPELVDRLRTVLALTGRRVVAGPVLTVSTVTGTELRAATLTARLDPVAEGMEGYAVGTAAAAFGVPVAEIRAISNQVGRRDRNTWNMPAALAGLRTAAGVLVAHPDGLLATPPARTAPRA